MTDTNFISSEPRNKSFDENIRFCNLEKKAPINNSETEIEKVCFNPYCRNRGSKWIYIIGKADDYRDHPVPLCVCEKCFLPFTGCGPGRDHNEKLKSIPELKVCYGTNCYNKGKYWIDIYRQTIIESGPESEPEYRWLGSNFPFCLCKSCYAYFEDKRKDSIYHDTEVTVEEFCGLLQSSKFSQEMTIEKQIEGAINKLNHTDTQARNSNKLTPEVTTDNHLEEAAKSHDFEDKK